MTHNTVSSFATVELASTNLRKGFKESTVQQQPFGIEIAFTKDDLQASF